MPVTIKPSPPRPVHYPPAQQIAPPAPPDPARPAPARSEARPRIQATGAGSAATFWGSNANFDEITSHALAQLWALCAAAVSYSDSNTVYNEFKELVGASQVSVAVEGNETIPRAIWIDYQGFRVLVVRGTSTAQQFALYKTSRVRPYLITDTWLTPAASETEYAASGPRAFGYLFEAFVNQAQPIHDAIKTAYQGGEARPLYVVGHSLGAALLDLACCRMGKELFNAQHVQAAGWAGMTANSAYRAFCERFRDNPLLSGGYLFGEPRLGYTATARVAYLRGNNEPSTPAGETAHLSTLGFWFNELAVKLRHFYHWGDPIVDVPYAYKDSPWWVWWATKGGGSADYALQRGSQEVSYGYRLRDENLQKLRVFPPNPAEFKDRAEKYHLVEPLLDLLGDEMVGRHGPMPAAWSAIINYAKALPNDAFSPTF